VGAVGLTQLLPSTARWMAPGTTRSDLMTPETNLRVGFQYLRYLMDKYGGDEKLALTAYNRGPGTVSKLLARGKNPDNGYAEKVLTGRSALHVRLMNAKFGG
jgi:soluble lytic murein transglycosylase-like protein